METLTLPIPALFSDPDALHDAPSLSEHPEHDHRDCTAIGYVVRKTRVRGVTSAALSHGRVGVDVAVFPGALSFEAAVDVLAATLRGEGADAELDRMFPCGCRG